MLNKTRILSIPDTGDRSDSKRVGSTTTLYYGTSLYHDIADEYEYLYGQARPNASWMVQPPPGAGLETLTSTTMAEPLFNNCFHTRKWGFCYPYLAAAIRPPASGYYQPYWRKETPYAANSMNKLPALLSVPWAEIDEIQRRAWWSMQPRFETEVQLLNFIYELKDFKSLVKSAGNFNWHSFTVKVRKARRLKSTWRLSRDKKTSTLADIGNSLANVTGGLSAAWLAWAFAWKPLIKDLTEIHKLLKATVNQVQEEFLNRGLETQNSHYSEIVRLNAVGSNSGAYLEFFTGSRALILFTSTLQYTYSYVMRDGLEKYKKAMGLDLTTEVIWNALPFSFVADYFMDIGKSINRMSVDENVALKVHQYCESILTESFIGIGTNPQNSCYHVFYAPCVNRGKGVKSNETFTALTGYKEQRFQRYVTSPNKGTALPQFRLPSSHQVANLVALVRCLI